MTDQERLYAFAKNIAYPFIREQPFYADNADRCSVLLVGSTATGLCSESSDVDICILCNECVFENIANGTHWVSGRPSEVRIADTQLHYYAISYERLLEKLNGLDDISFYVYGTAIPFCDESGLFEKLKETIHSAQLYSARKEKAYDVLTRRNRAMRAIFKQESDPLMRMRIALEMIEHVLTATALSDNVLFDVRKRFFSTALTGTNGDVLKARIEMLTGLVSDIRGKSNGNAAFAFMQIMDSCIAALVSGGL